MHTLDVSPLFQAGRIGTMSLKNRLVFPALSTKLANADGSVSDDYLAFCEARARGGVGMIIIENTCVDWPHGKGQAILTRADSSEFVPGLHRLAERMRPYGVKIGTQLQHVGRQTRLEFSGGRLPVAPSIVPPFGQCDLPTELAADEIDGILDKYAAAARRSKEAGLDFVELHGGHGYLVTQFLSPFLNRRTDRYGGSFENRMRFALELVHRVRAAVGTEFPILFRMSVDEHVEPGLTPDEAVAVALKLEQAGIDAFHVTAGIYESREWIFPPMAITPGYNLPLAARIKQALRIPVIVVGKLGDPALASQAIASGQADFIALGRPLVADPLLPRKWARGVAEEVIPCIYCNECISHGWRQWRIRCTVNPHAGREREWTGPPVTGESLTVLVIGGGPAGMHGAITLAQAGHRVVLCEQGTELGGNLRLAMLTPHKESLAALLKSYEQRLAALSEQITVQLNTAASVDFVRSLAPDMVVVATGATQRIAFGEGNPAVFDIRQALTQPEALGRRVIISGGGEYGCAVAEFLAAAGASVTIVAAQSELATDMDPISRSLLLKRLPELGVGIQLNARVTAVSGRTATVESGGRVEQFEADAVVVSEGFASENALVETIRNHVAVPVVAIGDCVQLGGLFSAIHEADRVLQAVAV